VASTGAAAAGASEPSPWYDDTEMPTEGAPSPEAPAVASGSVDGADSAASAVGSLSSVFFRREKRAIAPA
jgi:hypothetical protein